MANRKESAPECFARLEERSYRFRTEAGVSTSGRLLGYSLLANRKTLEGTQHADRDARFEHRMFCHITENWRGRPLVSRVVVVNLIGHTRTKIGLTVRSELDENSYPTGQSVSDEQMQALNLKRDMFHGEWNYTLTPK